MTPPPVIGGVGSPAHASPQDLARHPGGLWVMYTVRRRRPSVNSVNGGKRCETGSLLSRAHPAQPPRRLPLLLWTCPRTCLCSRLSFCLPFSLLGLCQAVLINPSHSSSGLPSSGGPSQMPPPAMRSSSWHLSRDMENSCLLVCPPGPEPWGGWAACPVHLQGLSPQHRAWPSSGANKDVL